MRDSLWTATARLPHFEALRGNIDTDVLVIGGGMAGILTARFLQDRGISCVVAEKGTVGGGITGNTTAKLTAQHGLIYHQLEESLGTEQAGRYLHANLKALERYAAMAQTVSCDYEVQENAVYSKRDREILENEMKTLQRLKYPAELREHLPLPFDTKGAVVFPRQGQFHPLKFLRGVLRDLTVYEHTWVRELAGTTAITDNGKIRAKRIVVATHFPFLNKHGWYFLKLYQHRSYVLALQNAPVFSGMYVDHQRTGLSFRFYGDTLLLGGGGHRTGKDGGNWNELRAFATTHYPQAREIHAFAAQDCISLDGIPYVGQYAKSTPHLFVATGFNKWGMTGSMVAAQLLADRLTGRENEYADLFDPARRMCQSQLWENVAESATHLLSLRTKRCPHLGCALQWNKAEHSWDCPCHGSRFEPDGTLLNNPANGDMTH